MAVPLHSLLRRQLRRHFGESIPEALEPFLDAVNQAYEDSDEDRLMLERALELSSKELLRANADLRALIGSFPDLFFRLEPDGSILDCRGGREKTYLLPSAELVGKRIQDVPVAAVGQLFLQALDRVKAASGPVTFEYRLPGEGEEQHFEARLFPVFEGQIMAIIQNITERKRTEDSLLEAQDQLRQSQKMEAIGRLAGGVAHDFNNLLTAIRGYCDLSLTRVGDGPALQKYLLEIRKVSDRAALLTRQLLAFSRRQVLQPKLMDLNESVNSMETMLRRLIGENVELTVILDPQLRRIKADPGQIEQVIMNLVINARDAQPTGGRIIIGTQNARDDQGGGPLVILSVTDTGSGMNPETLSRIFEPFYTTKEAGSGTGLGLSMVYGIVRQSGGRIGVESEPGWGSTFRIALPGVEGDIGFMPVEGEEGSAGGSETLLLVEDEDMVRDVTRDILQAMGYRVLCARGGTDALACLQEHPGPIPLVMTDLVMPGMNGRELVDRIHQLRPGMAVLYTSGYTSDSAFYEIALPTGASFLQKPFSADALTRMIRSLLDARTPG